MRVLAVAIFLVLSAARADAQETATPAAEDAPEINPLLAACLKEQAAEPVAQACTIAIESRQLQGEALSSALYARGVASPDCSLRARPHQHQTNRRERE